MARDDLSLHDLISNALDRAADAQEQSHELVERQQEVTAAIHETLEAIRRRRRSETDTPLPGTAPRRGSRNRQ
jgi:hypothetical protein